MNTYLIDNSFHFDGKFQRANHLSLVSKSEIESSLPKMSSKRAIWLTKSASFRSISKPSFESELLRLQKFLKRYATLIICGSVEKPRHRQLSLLFKNVVVANENSSLTAGEIVEVLNAPNAANLVITADVDHDTKTIVLTRGNLEILIVPFSCFKESGDGTRPDFKKISLTDHGQTLILGDYEASIDGLLYEFDPEIRKELKKNRSKNDKSLGACLKRLRLQKGVRQADFAGIDPKEIGRIERGEVKKPHKTTLHKIAQKLDVSPDEILEY